MFFEKTRMALSRLTIVILASFISLTALACTHSRQPAAEILGLHVGMDRGAAQAHLSNISKFIRGETRNQEIWKLNDTSRFGTVAIGYKENKVRYVTAFVDKEERREPIAFSSLGDLRQAKAEISEPHFRYIWDVPASGQSPACSVNVYGDNPEFVTMYTLVERGEAGRPVQEDEDDD
jgi:hypothetical protein